MGSNAKGFKAPQGGQAVHPNSPEPPGGILELGVSVSKKPSPKQPVSLTGTEGLREGHSPTVTPKASVTEWTSLPCNFLLLGRLAFAIEPGASCALENQPAQLAGLQPRRPNL
jgi:hypothetical protein